MAMRVPTLLARAAVATVALGIALVVTTSIAVLSALDSATDFPIEPLIHGDLRPLLASGAFARAFPSLPFAASLWSLGPAVILGVFAGLLVEIGHRTLALPAPAMAAAMLLAGAIPFAIGALALHDNSDPHAAGQWLLWMLAGPGYAAVGCLPFLLLRRRELPPSARLTATA